MNQLNCYLQITTKFYALWVSKLILFLQNNCLLILDENPIFGNPHWINDQTRRSNNGKARINIELVFFLPLLVLLSHYSSSHSTASTIHHHFSSSFTQSGEQIRRKIYLSRERRLYVYSFTSVGVWENFSKWWFRLLGSCHAILYMRCFPNSYDMHKNKNTASSIDWNRSG